MSDTTQKPEAVPAPPQEPQPAPEGEAAPEQQPERSDEEKRAERRINRLTSRLSQVARDNEELQRRLAQAEAARTGQTQQPVDPQLQQYIAQEAERLYQVRAMDEKTRAFHAQGRDAYPDWTERCTNLQAMGADAQIAQLLVEMRDGPKIAAALHDEPDELERIASIRSERGRAVALGQFAAKIEAKPARPVSRAPKPPTPVTQRAIPEFNPYVTDDMSALVKHFSGPGRPP